MKFIWTAYPADYFCRCPVCRRAHHQKINDQDIAQNPAASNDTPHDSCRSSRQNNTMIPNPTSAAANDLHHSFISANYPGCGRG
ncbi:hypothetical protein ACFWFU_05345 [Streptomyces sp. NPDC060235]|uniref:hypothetical protein n=1 Tax=unclassified Streptomyces TaxID=2593676 RepID=UPI003664FAF5